MDQLLSAIAIVADPTQSRELQAQAIEYLNTIRSNPEQFWQLALKLFVEVNSNKVRAQEPQIRAFALQILDDLLNARLEPLDESANIAIKEAFLAYIRSEYLFGTAESQASFIRNKFSHTLALFFISSYPHQWPDFFSTFYHLLRSDTSTPLSTAFNQNVSSLFLRVMIEISGEVADTILKGARDFSEPRHIRDGLVRDHMRDRDSKDISDAVLSIMADGEAHLVARRRGSEPGNPSELEDLISLAVRSFASLIPWININFTVTPDTIPLLFRLLSDPSQNIRVETASSFLRIVLKGLKEPSDKVQLIRVLSLREVLESVEENTRGFDGNELFREALGKLANGLGLELCKLVEEATLSQDMRNGSQQFLNELLPITLRFLADEYDDTSQTVHQFLSAILNNYKRAKKNTPHTHMTQEKREFLSSFLQEALKKMKWDIDTDIDDLDDDDKSAFSQMRKELKHFMDSILVIDEELVNSYAQGLTMSTLQAYQAGAVVSWQDLELAVHLVFLYGEFHKGVKGPSAFLHVPEEIKAELKSTTPNSRKPRLIYADYALNAHGEMMMALVQSDVFSYDHPFVVTEAFETLGRYGAFFFTRKECIAPVLSAFIGTTGIHNERASSRGRLYYLFHRFIKDVRSEIPEEVAVSILNSIGDLMILNIELPEEESPQDDLLESAVNTPTLFDSQIYLFETAGTLLSLLRNAPEEQLTLLRALTTPLLGALEESLQVQMLGPQDVLPVLKVHHLIRALGNVSKGFPDAPAPFPVDHSAPEWVTVFDQVADALLVSLIRMSQYKIVREATRFAFSRIITATGPAIKKYIPSLMFSMLTSCAPDELPDFINFLGLIVHRLDMEIFDVLDELTGPLYHHITDLLLKPVDGTDAKMAHISTKKAYLEVLVTIMSGGLFVVFVSERNKSLIEPVCQLVLTIANDTSDPPSQRAAWTLLARFTTHFGKTETEHHANAVKRAAEHLAPETYHPIPGYEGFIYDRLIPLAFELPNQPGFNIKDGQSSGVLGEVGTLLVATRKARGQEVLDYFTNVFLPSKGWPKDAISTFVSNLVEMDTKNFKKYWTSFVRQSLTGGAR